MSTASDMEHKPISADAMAASATAAIIGNSTSTESRDAPVSSTEIVAPQNVANLITVGTAEPTHNTHEQPAELGPEQIKNNVKQLKKKEVKARKKRAAPTRQYNTRAAAKKLKDELACINGLKENCFCCFKLFPKLPTEIRFMIWRYLPIPQVIISSSLDLGLQDAAYPRVPQPCILHRINRESRQVFKELYTAFPAKRSPLDSIFINLKVDTVYIHGPNEIVPLGKYLRRPKGRARIVPNTLRHLAISLSRIGIDHRRRRRNLVRKVANPPPQLRRFATSFPHLVELLFVFGFIRHPWSSPGLEKEGVLRFDHPAPWWELYHTMLDEWRSRNPQLIDWTSIRTNMVMLKVGRNDDWNEDMYEDHYIQQGPPQWNYHHPFNDFPRVRHRRVYRRV